MKIRKLLFVTDFEELWFDALQSLMDLRKAGLEHVIFLTCNREGKSSNASGCWLSKG